MLPDSTGGDPNTHTRLPEPNAFKIHPHAACASVSFLFKAESRSAAWIGPPLLARPWARGLLPFLATVSSAA